MELVARFQAIRAAWRQSKIAHGYQTNEQKYTGIRLRASTVTCRRRPIDGHASERVAIVVPLLHPLLPGCPRSVLEMALRRAQTSKVLRVLQASLGVLLSSGHFLGYCLRQCEAAVSVCAERIAFTPTPPTGIVKCRHELV